MLQLKSKSGPATLIDFEEGGQQRWVVGVSASNDNFVIASGSALSKGMLFQVDRTSKDVEITNNLSASAVSASTYYGDGSNLTGITSVWKDETTYISSSVPIKVDGNITSSANISASGYVQTNFLVGGLRRSTSAGYDDAYLNVNGDLVVANILRLTNATPRIKTGGG